jgi:hypothetical protein
MAELCAHMERYLHRSLAEHFATLTDEQRDALDEATEAAELRRLLDAVDEHKENE